MIILQNCLDHAVWLVEWLLRGEKKKLNPSSVSYRQQHLYVESWAARCLHQNPEDQRTQNVEFIIIIYVILVCPTFFPCLNYGLL